MNILIINQPLNNRGDESAHKALVRALSAVLPVASIRVLFAGSNANSVQQFSVNSERIEYINVRTVRGFARLSKLILKKRIYWLWYFHPTTNKLLKYYKEADWVICAPGGICMGGFQDWGHLSSLKMAQYVGKPLAYYGRSFGPFPIETNDNKRFKEISLDLLHYFSFISIRDAQSEILAESLGLKYISTLDTAFLDSPRVPIPEDVKNLIGGNQYVVFVPNLLIWHYAYKESLTKETVLEFYLEIYREIIRNYPNDIVLMLPQTFNYMTYEGDDINFFYDLKSYIDDEKVVVIPDKYSSDIQQSIISGADCVIGARYHSIVFAINNKVPFIALSYEHKIAGLLQAVGGENAMVDITHLKANGDINSIVSSFALALSNVHFDTLIYDRAKRKAKDCFDCLVNILYKNEAR